MPASQSSRGSETPQSWLLRAIAESSKASKFVVHGLMPTSDPGIVVNGVGSVSFPLQPNSLQPLLAAARIAPYGKGVKTLVDTRVRQTYEIDAAKIQVSDAWKAALAETTRTLASALGLPPERLEARLYKLLIYEKDGFFLTHRDSEKQDRMVASLVVVLPNAFQGGRLCVRHGEQQRRFDFFEAARERAASYVAFYADCEHEVEKVTHGVRVALAYNLVLRAGTPTQPVKLEPVQALSAEIANFCQKQPAEPLVVVLEHEYTQHGLAFDLLKGADRQLADQLVAAADNDGRLLVHLAQVSRHLSQYAEDQNDHGRYSRGSRDARSPKYDIGETYEDIWEGSEWVDRDGHKHAWGSIGFASDSVISAMPQDEWTPVNEEYEGYTGNAGNTLDRWYRKSAIVLWQRDHHYEVIARAGFDIAVPLLRAMVAKLKDTPRQQSDAARADCLRFARCVVANGFTYSDTAYELTPEKRERIGNDFQRLLITLQDRETIAAFLQSMRNSHTHMRLGKFIVNVCHKFGWNEFSPELEALISQQSGNRSPEELSDREIEWLAAYCDAAADSPEPNVASQLCEIAVRRFVDHVEKLTAESIRYSYHPCVAEPVLTGLLQALAASGLEDDLSRVIRRVLDRSWAFSFEDMQIPSLVKLLAWSRERFGRVLAAFQVWLRAIRTQLIADTATAPSPPKNWSRAANASCKCEYCVMLNTFLADPGKEVSRIAARAAIRQHLTSEIASRQCDVRTHEEAVGSPYTLVLTKTFGSYERETKRFAANQRLLAELPADDFATDGV